ncbi:hypothetical protein TYRP_009851, partial [Tyrophagus putrescentiae]
VQLRAIHFTLTVDMESESSLRANIAVNPLGALLVGQYRFLTITVAYPVFIATFWILYLDYMFTYQMKGVFLDTAYLALVSNGKNFQALNSHWLNFPSIETTFSWWHWWRSPAKYLALWKQILNISKGKNSTLNTVCHFHPHLIWSIRLSSQLRGRLYVFSHLAELLVQQQQHKHNLLLFLSRFYHDYRCLQSLATTANSQLTSRFLFISILANLPINLVLVGNLLFRQLPPIAISMILICLLAQTFVPLILATLFTSITDCLYRSDPLIRAKLHLAVFYETVCTKNKVRFTFGPHAKVCYRSMFEFLFVYSGFLLYIAKMIKNGRL